MEPNNPNSPGFSSPETGPILPTPEVTQEAPVVKTPEKAPANQEVKSITGDNANQNQGMQIPKPIPHQASTNDDDDTQSTITDTPDLANDVDVIEKEWVEKAKQIVGNNSSDPYKQNHEVSVLKADYMKKRYGKEVKLPKDGK